VKKDQVRITLRIPADVHAQAVALARGAERSLNWQMVSLLKAGVAAAEAQKEKALNSAGKQ